jgi:hypothetical protein
MSKAHRYQIGTKGSKIGHSIFIERMSDGSGRGSTNSLRHIHEFLRELEIRKAFIYVHWTQLR